MIKSILIHLLLLLCIACSILFYNIGKNKANKDKHPAWNAVKGFLENIDNYVIILSVLLFTFSVFFSVNQSSDDIAVLCLNVFASLVFSWIMTKKSAKREFKEREEELALKSYRHINYIESSAKKAFKEVEEYLKENPKNEACSILSKTMSGLQYIQGGINTCKMDWLDLLSPEEQEKENESSSNEETEQEFIDEKITISNSEINQEDA